MRVLLFTALAAASTLRFCGFDSKDEAPPPPPQAASAPQTVSGAADVRVAARARKPRHHGTVTVIDNHPVEVVPTSDGHVYAYVAGPAGVVPPPNQVQLTVNVNVRQGGVRPVHMVWNPTLFRYEGVVQGATPAPGPADVMLTIDGRPETAHVRHLVVVPPARFQVVARGAPPGAVVWVHVPPGQVRVRGDVRGPVPPRARVDVVAPRPPRVRIDVQAPPPPRVEVGGSIRFGGSAGFGEERGREDDHDHGRGHAYGREDDHDHGRGHAYGREDDHDHGRGHAYGREDDHGRGHDHGHDHDHGRGRGHGRGHRH